VPTLSVVALSVLVEVGRPLNRIKACIVGATYAGLALVLAVPFLSELFMLEWPPPALVAAAFVSALSGAGAIAVLARFHTRRIERATETGPGTEHRHRRRSDRCVPDQRRRTARSNVAEAVSNHHLQSAYPPLHCS
jgi:hypothetical protein